MSQLTLKRLVGAALVDRDFCEGFMNGRRSELLAQFELTEEERTLVSTLKAESVREFASHVHDWLTQQETSIPLPIECDSAPALQESGA